MSSPIRAFFETIWLYCKGFRPVEFVRDDERVSLHSSGWRANGSGRFKRAKDAVSYLESAAPEQWRQIYCGMTPFLVSDKGNVKHIDGSVVKMSLANGRYQIMYKPEDPRGRGKDGRIHKKRVYRSMLVAMAWLDFRKGDADHEIHHINGYRTDDRAANLMVVDHEEHMRIHNLGPCGLSGMPDERIIEASAACEGGTCEPETFAGSHVALKAPHADEGKTAGPRKKKRRRGKRGGKGRAQAPAEQTTRESSESNEHEEKNAVDAEHATPAATSKKGSSSDTSDAEAEQVKRAPEDDASRECAPDAGQPVESADRDGSEAPDNGSRQGRRRRKKDRDESRMRSEGAASGGARPEDGNAAPNASRRATEGENEATGRVENSSRGSAETQAADRGRSFKGGEKADAAAKTEDAVDRSAARTQLSDALDDFLKAVGADDAAHTVEEKEATKAAKPVYRAMKPFLTCPDAVASFDAALSSIRTIAQAYRDSGAEIPAPVHSMLGTLHQVLKDAVKRIAAEGDEIETACLREMLCEEASKPLFKKTTHARKFRQCISVVDSRNETEPERP